MQTRKAGGRSKDHIKPKSKGGSNERFNLIISCFECNNWKSDKTLEDWLFEIETLLKKGQDFKHFNMPRLGQIRKSIKQMLAKPRIKPKIN